MTKGEGGPHGMRRRQTDPPESVNKYNHTARNVSREPYSHSDSSKTRRKWSRRAIQIVVYAFLSILVLTVKSGIDMKRRLSWVSLGLGLRFKKEMTFPEMAVFRISKLSSVSYFSIDRSLPELKIPIEPDFGGFKIRSLEMEPPHRFRRIVQRSDLIKCADEREALFEAIDDSGYMSEGFEDIDYPTRCITPKWTADMTQVCNNVHELSYDRPPQAKDQTNDIQRLSNGFFRQTYLFVPEDGSKDFVAKNFRYERDLTQKNFKSINVEARIMESLTQSDLISDIYGHCGSTVLVEKAIELTYRLVPRLPNSDMDSRGRISQELLNQWQVERQDGVFPMNNYTTVEKLDTAIRMAESLAELHGHPNGVIVHDDVSIDQWMYSVDGRVILNDFNNNMALKWNHKKDRYCSGWSNYPGGSFKAPEVYGDGSWTQEQVDIWPMGNLIFTLLTGLKPYHDTEDNHEIQNRFVRKGIPPFINPLYRTRSYIEQQLVEIMNQCYKLDPYDRPTIFEVIQQLKTTKKEYKSKSLEKPKPEVIKVKAKPKSEEKPKEKSRRKD